jgi:hypothetical protein
VKHYTRLFTVLIGLFCVMLLQVMPQIAQAKINTPATTYCGGGSGCLAYWQWPSGDSHGIRATVSTPNMSVATNSYIDVYLEICSNSACNTSLRIGLEDRSSGVSGQGECFNNSGGLYYFYDVVGNTPVCVLVPNGDFGHAVTFQESYYTSNGGGMFFKVTGASGEAFCPSGGACFVAGITGTYQGPTTYAISYQGPGFSSDQFSTKDFTANQYQQVITGSPWKYVHSDPPNSFIQWPPYANWSVFPSQSTTGGDMYGCLLASSSLPC